MRQNIMSLIIVSLLMLVSARATAASQDAGMIGNFTDILCMDKTDTYVEMEVQNIREASLDGTAIYAYQLLKVDENGHETLVETFQENASSATLIFIPGNYTGIDLPAVFHLKRIVSTDEQNWLTSSGQCTFTVAKNEYTMSEETYCKNDLPVTGVYTYYDGRTETYIFRSDSLEKVFVDRTELGCIHEHTIRCIVADVPQVEVDSLGNVCQTDDKMQITYHIIKGAPTNCKVEFDEVAHEAGFADTDVELTEENIITLDMPTLVRKEYGISLSFYDKNSTNGCQSDTYTQQFSLNLGGFIQEKWDDVLFVDNNDKNCNPDCESDMRFKAFQWYKNGLPIDGETGQVYYEEGGLNGRYYVVMTDTAGNNYRSCEVVRRPVIESSSKVAPLHIAPVPAQTQEMITIDAAGEGRVMITDLAGRTLLAKETDGKEVITTAPSKAGVYVVSFIGADGSKQAQKLIVR